MDDLLQSETGNPSGIEIEIGEIDWISELPEFILHRILFFSIPRRAPPAELVRMSVLSKKWFDLTASFAVLDFNIHHFNKVSRQSFFKYVENTTSRFCHQMLPAHRFQLITSIGNPAELDIVNRCLELVLKNGVWNLEIDITYTRSSSLKYRLPNILLSVSMLRYLIIRGCELPSSFMVDDLKFKSLLYLTLENVCIDDEVIKYITTSCPLLEVFQIGRCHGFKRFCVYGHQNLQSVWIDYNSKVERIDIEAPNLYDLLISVRDERGAPPMNLASCKKLTSVTYYGYPLPNSNGFTDFLSNIPFIKNLRVVTDYNGNNLKLASHSLRTLVIQTNCDLDEIELNAPNLVLFIYCYDNNLLWPLIMDKRWPLLRDSPYLKACMQCYPDSYVDTLWFQKLRQFLDKKDGFKVLNLYIRAIYSQKFTELEKLKAIKLPPYELEHVELQLDAHEKSSDYVAFVEAVLWCCRPRSLTLRSVTYLTDCDEQFDVIMFTFMKLLEQEDLGHTKIRTVWPFYPESQNYRDFNLFSMALPYEGKKKLPL